MKKLNMNENSKFVFRKKKKKKQTNIVGKTQNAGYQHFFLSQIVFSLSHYKFLFSNHFYFVVHKFFRFGPAWNVVIWQCTCKRYRTITTGPVRETFCSQSSFRVAHAQGRPFLQVLSTIIPFPNKPWFLRACS